MPSGDIRLAPSGPPITNDEGGSAVPGNGFQLRLAEAAGSTAMAALTDVYQDITDIGGLPYEVSLAAPDPNKRYKFNFHCDVNEVAAAEQSLLFRVVAAYDGATFSNQLAENSQIINADDSRKMAIDVPMQLGSALGFPAQAPLPAGAPSITCRVQARVLNTGTAVIPNGGDNGTIWLSLAELL